jgi:hypothetical protein
MCSPVDLGALDAPGEPCRGARAPVVLDAGDVGGEEVDAVSVEVASGAVVVLGGAGVGVPGEDLGVAQGDAGVEGVGDAACRSECGLMCRGMPAASAIRATMR